MKRPVSMISVTLLSLLLLSVPTIALASTGELVPWHNRSFSKQSVSRNAKVQSTNPFKVQYQTAASPPSWSVRYFTSLTQAEDFANTKRVAAVFDSATGLMLYSTTDNLFEVKTLGASTGATPSQNNANFATVGAAVSAADNTPATTIINTFTQSPIWSNTDNYYMVEGSARIGYQFYLDALSAASAAPQSKIETGTAEVVWQAAFTVTVNGVFAKSFFKLSDAIAFATGQANSMVTSAATGKDIWDNIPHYAVYQNGTLLKQFAAESDAIAYASLIGNATVVRLSDQAVVYPENPLFYVTVSGVPTQTFTDESSAIAYAKTTNGALVLSTTTNQIVWTPAGAYGVYRYMQLMNSFATLSEAVSYAKTLDHAQVIETATGTVQYSNYPTSVSPPIAGETFTVENGQVVDQLPNAAVVIGPAPIFMQTGTTYVSDDYDHWYALANGQYTFAGVWENPYQTMNLETSSTLTAQQINAFFAANAPADSVLQNTGNDFVEAGQTYGVNTQYLVAHAIIESGWGTSSFARYRDNLFGYGAFTSNPDAAVAFRSIEYDINFQAWFVRNSYLSASGSYFNGPSLDGMNVEYATDPQWANSIARIMAEIVPYSNAIGSQPLLTETSNRAVFPYPSGATGKEMTNVSGPLTVYSYPADSSLGSPSVLGTIPQGVTFAVYGDAPGWDQVTIDSQVGVVNWNDVYLTNMLEVTGLQDGSVLNVRSSPSAASSANMIDQLGNGAYLVLLQPIQNGWANVEDGNGKTGWVSSQYVKVIH